MKLVGSRTSPYVRKVRVLLAEKAIAHEFLEENAWNAQTTVPRYNPLNKVPALVMDDGEAIYDSMVITEYLDTLGGAALLPAEAGARARARRDEALGNGLMDAGVTIFLERKRDAARQDAAWLSRQRDKIDAALATWSRSLSARKDPGALTLGDIACGCALFWFEFRLPDIRWRDDAALDAWARTLEARPSFASTRPPA
ncbi:MAG TPA: glutathione S-transferase N-terminal domain-containing protein [Usitatibacter sp.]|jgi:glutathione S-transferase|nr:glutathione S-transferase N-terminal domain-containing protein [Usitatibacter sp.]